MIRRFCLSACFASLILASAGSSVQAYDSNLGFAFGYSVGQANQFRNRLPAPPYFSVYPPVYYGKRYERPYGESPFASWPLLQSSSDYHAQLKQAPLQFVNPYVQPQTPCTSCSKPLAQATTAETGKMVTIINPYVVSSASVAAGEAGD